MIKATSKTDDGLLVICGLSEKNVELLKQDKPITFDLAEMGQDPYPVCISYRHPNGNAAAPVGFYGRLFAFNDEEFQQMRVTPRSYLIDHKWRFYVGKDEATMSEWHRGLIGPETVVRTQGYAPSDKPINPN